MNEAYAISYYQSPIGIIEIKSVDDKICSVLFVEKETKSISHHSPINNECINQLKDYFAGTRFVFNLQIIQNGTSFQKQVWNSLLNISYGTTISYGKLAQQLGNAKTVRAVGTTNGKNQLLIIVPCHRVIAGDGNLTGYAGELWRKEWLLKHEIEYAQIGEGKLF